jgi:hypothetical protein
LNAAGVTGKFKNQNVRDLVMGDWQNWDADGVAKQVAQQASAAAG